MENDGYCQRGNEGVREQGGRELGDPTDNLFISFALTQKGGKC